MRLFFFFLFFRFLLSYFKLEASVMGIFVAKLVWILK